MGSSSAVFLDRDGTLIEDVGYPSRPDDVKLLPEVGPALRTLSAWGLPLVVVSNQSGVGRGLFTVAQAEAVHNRLVEDLECEGVTLDGAYYCYHGPDEGCPCRKPAPGLILRGAEELDLDVAASVLVGNTQSDIDAGRNAGSRTIAFAAPGVTGATWTVESWPAVVEAVLEAVGAA